MTITAMGSMILPADDLLAWSRSHKHFHATERTEHSRECAFESREAERHLAAKSDSERAELERDWNA